MTRTAIIVSVVSVLLLPIVALAMMSLFARRPQNLGVVAGRLAACPASPNCVCSQETDKPHQIEPLEFGGSAADAIAQLKTIIASSPRAEIIDETDTYLHAEFTSGLFRFTDDVEFLIDEPSGVIHIRSASRSGHSDLGVNRARMEAIRKELSGKTGE
jgi:uncharacterized protein (DUF1499 family)